MQWKGHPPDSRHGTLPGDRNKIKIFMGISAPQSREHLEMDSSSKFMDLNFGLYHETLTSLTFSPLALPINAQEDNFLELTQLSLPLSQRHNHTTTQPKSLGLIAKLVLDHRVACWLKKEESVP